MAELPLKHPPIKRHQELSDMLYLQNLPSIFVGHVLDPRPHERILDMCASPGGKTAHLACLTRCKAQIVAVDRTAAKVGKIRETMTRFGADACTRLVVGDSTRLTSQDLDGQFDAILLDPPCSGLGQRPKLIPFDDDSPLASSLDSFPSYQERLIRNAWTLLKPGGRLVYSTCTLNPDENEKLIYRMIDLHSDMSLMHIDTNYGAPIGADNFMRSFVPGESCDTIGFFIAKVLKAGG